MRKILGGAGLFTFCFLAGYGLLKSNTDEYQINRDPAAVRNSFDFSHLSGEKLQEAVKQRLLTGLEIKKNGQGAGIALGHFVYVDERGTKKLACQEFRKVFLNFEAEGVSIGGEKPQMEVEGRCDFSEDMSRINALYVPVARILGERPGDGEFQFNEGPKVTVRFTNLPEDWPRTWLLKSVKLVNESASEALVVEGPEVAQTLGHPVVFSW